MLSETIGSAKELNESIIIIQTLVVALNMTLNMPIEEQIRRNKLMQDRLSNYDAVKWADDFIENLSDHTSLRLLHRIDACDTVSYTTHSFLI